LWLGITQSYKNGRQLFILLSTSLSKTIKRFSQLAELTRFWRNYTFRNLHIYFFIRSTCKKALLTSSCSRRQFLVAAMANKSLTIVILATEEKVSLEPSTLCLVLYTHLHPTVCFPIGRSTNSQVSVWTKALISSSMAFLQFSCFIACAYVLDSTMEEILHAKCLWLLENLSN